MADIPFNMNSEMDDDFKDVAEDAAEMKLGIAFLLERSEKADDDIKKALILAKAGIFSRIVENYDNSEKYLIDAIKILKANDMTKQATDLRVRLAVTHLAMNRNEEAEKIFNEVLERAKLTPKDEGLAKLKEVALVSLGKSKFAQNQISGAIRSFKEAAEQKMNRGDSAGASKLNKAIKVAQDKMNEATGANDTATAPDNFIDPLLDLDSGGDDE